MGKLGRTVVALVLILANAVGFAVAAQSTGSRMISGVVVGPKGEILKGATIAIRDSLSQASTTTDDLGQFIIVGPTDDATLHVEGQYIKPMDRVVKAGEASSNVRIEIEYS